MKHPDNAIKSNSPKKIWESLHFILGKTCKKESCWLRHKCLKENVDLSVLKEDFSPTVAKEAKLITLKIIQIAQKSFLKNP